MAKVLRKFVLPGDLIVKGNYPPAPNTYQMDDGLHSLKVGLSEIEGRNVRVIPLAGRYVPRPDDLVVGVVIDLNAFAWSVDINSFFPAFLTATDVFGKRYSPESEDLSSKFDIGDVIIARVAAYDRSKDPMLTVAGPKLGRVNGGYLMKISPVKVPRLIGRRGSMSKMIEEATGTRITIGQNGIIVINGEPSRIPLAVKAIEMVETQAHLAGLSVSVQNFLSKETGRVVRKPQEGPPQSDDFNSGESE
ncbi:MAG: RNA-binding protein [Nitrososphaerota archaeon]|jgi:exosome complex component RRP4|nr:RNA-binding protein [Nitrososphaerota archaeon]